MTDLCDMSFTDLWRLTIERGRNRLPANFVYQTICISPVTTHDQLYARNAVMAGAFDLAQDMLAEEHRHAPFRNYKANQYIKDVANTLAMPCEVVFP